MDRIGNNAQSKVLPEYEKSTLSNLNYLCLSTHIVHIYIYLYLSWSFPLGTHMIANCLASVRPSRCKIWCLSRVQDEKSAASIWIYFTAIHHSKVYIYFTYNTYIYIYMIHTSKVLWHCFNPNSMATLLHLWCLERKFPTRWCVTPLGRGFMVINRGYIWLNYVATEPCSPEPWNHGFYRGIIYLITIHQDI